MTIEQIILAILGVFTSGSLGFILKAILDHRRGIRKDGDATLLEVLQFTHARVETVESQLDQVRKEAAVEREKGKAREGYLRHRLGNALHCLDSTLLIFAVAPEKAAQLIEGIKQMRAAHERAEGAERAALAAIGILVDDPEPLGETA